MEKDNLMAHWLLKTEADVFGWSDQAAVGPGGAPWHGIRNYQARNNMRAMAVGDSAFFYHTGNEKAVVGIVTVTALSAPDPTTDDPRWDCVSVAAVRPLLRPVPLEVIRQTPELADMVLVKNSRLSVQPVTATEWATVCAMGGLTP
jgi:predicted RNA-binding protein with PUA-like domain